MEIHSDRPARFDEGETGENQRVVLGVDPEVMEISNEELALRLVRATNRIALRRMETPGYTGEILDELGIVQMMAGHLESECPGLQTRVHGE